MGMTRTPFSPSFVASSAAVSPEAVTWTMTMLVSTLTVRLEAIHGVQPLRELSCQRVVQRQSLHVVDRATRAAAAIRPA